MRSERAPAFGFPQHKTDTRQLDWPRPGALHFAGSTSSHRERAAKPNGARVVAMVGDRMQHGKREATVRALFWGGEGLGGSHPPPPSPPVVLSF